MLLLAYGLRNLTRLWGARTQERKKVEEVARLQVAEKPIERKNEEEEDEKNKSNEPQGKAKGKETEEKREREKTRAALATEES